MNEDGENAEDEGLVIARQALHGSVAGHLRAMIIRGELPPESKVPAGAIARALGVSITPVREAMKLLAEEGLIAWLPNRGARVLAFTAGEATALFEVMASLEGLAAELAASRMAPEALRRLEAMHVEMLDHFRGSRKAPYFALNSQIHEEILAAAENPILVETRAKLQMRAARGRFLAIVDQARWNEAVSEHEALMQCLRDRDSQQAGEVWRRHLLHTGAAVRRAQAAAGISDDA
jgi:DNA-binding GntR family transcriptional regulator